MPCSKCGKPKSSLQAEREREASAIKRREQAAQVKAQYAESRRETISRIREQRRQANRS